MTNTMITYNDQSARVACDRNCKKAWGINNRPRIEFNVNEPDDYAFLADDELGEAPANPGTTEGRDGKPNSRDEFPNKWCVRQCERCTMSEPGKYLEPLALPSFVNRRYNMPWLHGIEVQP